MPVDVNKDLNVWYFSYREKETKASAIQESRCFVYQPETPFLIK